MNAASLSVIRQLLRRDLQERYAGTALGIFWLIVQPLFMLLVYALVFGEILQMRTGIPHDSGQFGVWLFAGLLAFNGLADVLTRAPAILTERRDVLLNTPLSPAIPPLLPVGTSLVLELVSVALLMTWLLWQGQAHWLALPFYLPFLLLRLLLSLAFAYLLALLGVFLRDLRQLMPPLLTIVLLVSPIVYPLEIVPHPWQGWFEWNPLAHLVAGYRAALLDGSFLWEPFLLLLALATGLLVLAAWLLQKMMVQVRYVL